LEGREWNKDYGENGPERRVWTRNWFFERVCIIGGLFRSVEGLLSRGFGRNQEVGAN